MHQFVSVADIEENAGAEHQEPDPQHPCEQGDEEPVADIGDQFLLAPPRLARIAGPEMRQHREHQRQSNRDRHHLDDGLAEHLDDFQGQIRHGNLIRRGS